MVVKDIQELKELAKDGREFQICLNGGLRSSKYINFDGVVFWIENYIDGSSDKYTEDELIAEDCPSNIGRALKQQALITE